MSIDIKVPVMGESVTEATIAKWFKNVGDAVARDEPLVELETDKVTVEVPSPAAGTLDEIRVKQGQSVQVGTILGAVKEGAGAAKPAAPPAAKAEAPKGIPPAKAEPKPQPAAAKEAPRTPSAPMKIGEAVSALEARARPAPAKTGARPEAGREERVPMSRLRRTIALRLKESQNTAAQLTTFNEVDMSAVLAARAANKDSFEKKHGVKLGFMGFFVRACVAVLKEIPALNAEIDGDDIIYKNYFNIGIAVSTDKGLVVPVLRDADKLSLADIEKAVAAFAARARVGELKLDELQGGSFTITNGGVFGSLMSTPILNTPQTGILGMHKIQERPVARDGQVVIRPMMYVALSYDHRLVDGAEAVTFLVRVKQTLEDPGSLKF